MGIHAKPSRLGVREVNNRLVEVVIRNSWSYYQTSVGITVSSDKGICPHMAGWGSEERRGLATCCHGSPPPPSPFCFFGDCQCPLLRPCLPATRQVRYPIPLLNITLHSPQTLGPTSLRPLVSGVWDLGRGKSYLELLMLAKMGQMRKDCCVVRNVCPTMNGAQLEPRWAQSHLSMSSSLGSP